MAIDPQARALDGAALLRVVRHGATAANSAGLRCGGDLDMPMSAEGREQAAALALRVAALQPGVDLIVTSGLRRARETAEVVARALPATPVVVEPGFDERRLGQWNLWPVAQTQPWLEAGRTPPGGESDEDFAARIGAALRAVRPHLRRHTLLVGSRGVARMLGAIAGRRHPVRLDNAQWAEFRLADFPSLSLNVPREVA
jgi:probable phosphoglycerate mutase